MEIIFLGHSSFKLKSKNSQVITDPFADNIGFKFPKIEANIVTVSHDHDDHNNTSQILGNPKIISGPGEYEVGGVSIIGISSFHDNSKGTERGLNTIYVLEMDKLRIVHLGDLGHRLEDKILEDIGEVDILMIPVGGEYTIGPVEAVDIVTNLEPKIVIPMHYHLPGLNPGMFSKLETVDNFISKAGLAVEHLPKLVVKKEDFNEQQRLVVLEKRNV